MAKDELEQELKKLREENKKLIHYKKRLEFLQSISLEAVVVLDEELRCIEINHKVTELFGYKRKDVLGLKGKFFIAEEFREEAEKKALEKNIEPYETLMRRKDGTTFWGMAQGKMIESEGVELRIVTCRDISEQKKLQDETALLNAEYETIFNNSQVGILFLSIDRIIQRANQKLADIFGYESSNDFVGKSIEMIHLTDESFKLFGKYYCSIFADGKPVKVDYKFKKADGTSIWVNVSGSVVDKNYPPDLCKGIVWVFENIDDRKRAEVELQKAYDKLEVIFNNTVMGILVMDNERNIIRVNRVFANMFGYGSPEELENRSSRILHLSDENFINFSERFYSGLTKKTVYAGDFKVKSKDGTVFWVAASGRAFDIGDSSESKLGVIWSVMDITKRKDAETRLIELSRTDSLTKIYNRRYFYELVELELEIHKRYKRSLAFVIMDIDFFKKVNDTYGHSIGDRTLEFFAAAATSVIRKTDIFGRIGGEEFGLCLLEVDLKTAIDVVEKIREKLSMSLPDLNEGIPVITFSAGVAIVKEDENLEMVVRRADDLLYKAKKDGRDKSMS